MSTTTVHRGRTRLQPSGNKCQVFAQRLSNLAYAERDLGGWKIDIPYSSAQRWDCSARREMRQLLQHADTYRRNVVGRDHEAAFEARIIVGRDDKVDRGRDALEDGRVQVLGRQVQ